MTALSMPALFVALVVGASPPSPAELATEVKHRLGDVSVVRGDFEQQKQVKGFKKPLRSSGDFVIAKGHGVKWHTKAPFDSVLTVRKDDISSRQNGAEVFRLDASKEPTVRVINQVLFALLAGDLEVLTTHFDVTGTLEAKTWHLELAPKAAGLAQVLKKISLSGDSFVRTLELTEGSGDVTVITTKDPAAGPALSQAEEAGW